jgi:hypothetical protein
MLGEEKREGTSRVVGPGTADAQGESECTRILRPTDQVRSPSATQPLYHAPDPPVNSKGRVPRAGRLRAATVPPGERSQRVAADRP